MKSLIVYESMFGNTEHLARKVAEGLAQPGSHAVVKDVREAGRDDLVAADLLVIGAPTHAFSLSRKSTRDDAVRQGAEPSRASYGMREWLDSLTVDLPVVTDRPLVAIFDTRVETVRRLPGSAAKRGARILRGCGFRLVDGPTSFYVSGVKGPVTLGEFDRAREWGVHLHALIGKRSQWDVS